MLYSLITLVTFVLFGFSMKLKQKYSTNCLFAATMLACFRNISRLLDFEETKELMTQLQWQKLFESQIFHVQMMFQLVLLFIEMKYLRSVTILIYILFQFYAIKGTDKDRAFQNLYYQIGIFIFIGMIGKRIFKIVKEMDIKINDNFRFKNIFNNLDESIIIINDQNIDYVNKKFLMNFHSQIQEIYTNHPFNYEP